MSTANMKLVVLDVPLNGDMESPDQNLEDGEAIVKRVIEVRNLNKELKGMWCGRGNRRVLHSNRIFLFSLSPSHTEYEKKVRRTSLPYPTCHECETLFLDRIILSTQGCLTSSLVSNWQNAYERGTLLHR